MGHLAQSAHNSTKPLNWFTCSVYRANFTDRLTPLQYILPTSKISDLNYNKTVDQNCR